MLLKLLLFLVGVVWANEFGTYHDHWRKTIDATTDTPLRCGHDGYYIPSNDTCVCSPGFTGKACSTRICNNYGIPTPSVNPQRCTCPPGFLGPNCEPVRCVADNSKSYDNDDKEKAATLLVTYNYEMKESWVKSNENLLDTFCSLTGTNRIFKLSGFNVVVDPSSDKAACLKTLEDAEGFTFDSCGGDDDDASKKICPPQHANDISGLVTSSPPNSLLFVVINVNLTDITDQLSRQIIGNAISKRIKINVIVYPMVISPTSTLQWLQNLAASTLGTYVAYNGIDDTKFSSSPVVDQFIDFWKKDIRVAAVSGFTSYYFLSSEDVFIGARVDYDKDITVNGQKQQVLVDYHTWKLYKWDNSEGTNLDIKGQTDGTTAIVYSKDSLNVYSAFSTDDNVDAAYSSTYKDATYDLVARVEYNGQILSANDFKSRTIVSSSSQSIVPKTVDRKGCQFNVKIGSASCSGSGTMVQMVYDSVFHAGVFPVFCGENQEEAGISATFVEENAQPIQWEQTMARDTEIACNDGSAIVEKAGGRSFVIVSRKSFDSTNSNKSAVDNMYRNKNSVFYQLTDYFTTQQDSQKYSHYAAILYDEPDSKARQQIQESNFFGDFMTKVMNEASKSAEKNTGAEQYILQDILKTVLTSSTITQFRDVFIIIDSKTDLSWLSNVYDAIHSTRSKLFFIILKTYDFEIDYSAVNDLAVRSGGIAVTLQSYDQVKQFFTYYYPRLVANDVAGKIYSKGPAPGVAMPNIYMSAKEKYTLLVTNSHQFTNEAVQVSVSLSGIDTTFESVLTLGELQVFELDVTKSDKYSIRMITQDGPVKETNAVLLTDSTTFVSLSFFHENNGVGEIKESIGYKKGAFTPVLAWSQDQKPGQSVMTITHVGPTNPNEPVLQNGDISDNSICTGASTFPYFVDINWKCSSNNDIYHIKVDWNTTDDIVSRTFTFTCVDFVSGKCLNGGAQVGDACNCAFGYDGDVCQHPKCQNQGTLTTADTCNCPPGYTGFFCETSINACQSSPSKPDFRSEISSLIFVVDVNLLTETSLLTTPYAFPGAQIAVIHYGDSADPRLVLSSTNGNLLPDALKKPVPQAADASPSPSSSPPPVVPVSPYAALNKALDSQVTDRALIVLLASSVEFGIDQETVNRLAAQRAEIRIVTASEASVNTNTLALLGNGIPIVDTAKTIFTSDAFPDYFNKYLTSFFVNTSPQRILNVHSTGVLDGTSQKISFIDSTDTSTKNVAFVHLCGGSIDQTPQDSVTIGACTIYKFQYDGNAEFVVNLTPDDGKIATFSVERFSYLQTAYGFNSDTNALNEGLRTGLSYNVPSSLSIFPGTQNTKIVSSGPLDLPHLVIRAINSTTGQLGDPQPLFMTAKSSTCFYPFFTAIPTCTGDVIGYQAQLITQSTSDSVEERQQQFVFACHKASAATCLHGTNSGGVCNCDTNWSGISCSEPVCDSGVRVNTVCYCNRPYSGAQCSNKIVPSPTPIQTTKQQTTPIPTTTQSPPQYDQIFAFVIDGFGKDDYAYNSTIRAINEYTALFDMTKTLIMLTTNLDITGGMNFPFKVYDADSLSNTLNGFNSLRALTNPTVSVAKALQNVVDAEQKIAASIAKATNKNVFYLCQNALDNKDDTTAAVQKLADFTISSVASAQFMKTADDAVLTSLNKISSNVNGANTWWQALDFMVKSTKLVTKPEPAEPKYSCVWGMQSNMLFGIDRSKVTDDVEKNLVDFLKEVRGGFNYIQRDVNRCDAGVPSFYTERSVFAAFQYFNASAHSSSFCPSNYDIMINAAVSNASPAPSFTASQVKALGMFLNKACKCYRGDDPNTKKFVIWLPRSGHPLDASDTTTIGTLTSKNYIHIVVPMGYTVTDDMKNDKDLYYEVLKTNQDVVDKKTTADDYLLPSVNTDSLKSVVQQLWTKVCRLGGMIDQDTTASPPQLENFWQDFEY